jgi:hypothetical protein
VQVADFKGVIDANDTLENADAGQQLKAALEHAAATAADLNDEEALHGWAPTSWPQLRSLQSELEPYASLWQTAAEFSLAWCGAAAGDNALH